MCNSISNLNSPLSCKLTQSQVHRVVEMSLMSSTDISGDGGHASWSRASTPTVGSGMRIRVKICFCWVSEANQTPGKNAQASPRELHLSTSPCHILPASTTEICPDSHDSWVSHAPWLCMCFFSASMTVPLSLTNYVLSSKTPLWCKWNVALFNPTFPFSLACEAGGYPHRHSHQYTIPLGLRIPVLTLEISGVILKK